MLANSLSRVMPALSTSTSRVSPFSRRNSTTRRPASAEVTSSWSGIARSSLARRASSVPAPGTSSTTSRAPSAARVRAIAAPMPRAAPVTSAVRPASGSEAFSVVLPASVETVSSWPVMKALRAERKKRSAPTAPGASTPTPSASRMPLAVAPPRISCATERRNPSTPPRAASRAGSSPVAGWEIVTRRAPGARERIAPASGSSSGPSSAGAESSSATTITEPIERRSSTRRRTSAPSSRSRWATASAPAEAPSTTTGPSTGSGRSSRRRSREGRGRPSCLASMPPGAERMKRV